MSTTSSSSSQQIHILLVAPKSKLGSLILNHLLSYPNLSISILINDPSKDKNLVNLIQNTGGRAIKGDLKNPQTLKNATQGIHTVISTYRPLEENIHVEGHMALIQDCLENGVQRFVLPSFGLDISQFSNEELSHAIFVPQWLRLKSFIESQPLNTLEITQGIYIEQFLNEKGFWGDNRRQIEFTSYEDNARTIAAMVARAEMIGKYHVSGQRMTIREIVNVYNRVKGTNCEGKNKGSLEELKSLIQDKRERGDLLASKVLGLELIMNDERSLKAENDRQEFLDIKGCQIEEFLMRNSNENSLENLC